MRSRHRRSHGTVVLAPHPDDAAFSCGAAIQRAGAAGRSVLVLTLFSGGWRDDVRVEEERRASRALGCDVFLAGLPDAPFRGSSHRSLSGIVLGWDEAADGRALASATALLSGVLLAARPARLLAPLGVGRHVDHRISFLAALASSTETGIPVAFYEDRPYALVQGAVEHRLSELGTGPGAPGPGFLEALLSAPYVRQHLSGAAEAEELARGYAAIGAAGHAGPRLSLEPAIVRVREDSLPRLEEAVAAHASQLPAFLGSLPEWRAASASYAASLGASGSYAERIWRVRTSRRAPGTPAA
ncbi:PIG-L family deacetylase [Acidobacteria bacterium ACD]|nr:MAG: PIG-L family deacetylase [Acidobacteriota bacterium]MCE7957541.1 PIG-L family deacetylase [Acidobacteria bacterium ACB2]MDL1950199.1 PIG-L family deacetylase [Acidobacteria bacterium ACD]